MNEYIKIQEPKILNGRNLVFKLFFSKRIRKYFLSDNLIFNYDVEIGDPSSGILQIPAIASVITVAWAVGADVYVENLDETYLKSLNKVGSTLKRWYPEFSFSTKIIVGKAVLNKFSKNGYGLLFSSGIDSTASYIRHRHKKPNLITVFGAGVDIQLEHEKFIEKLMDFSRQEQVKLNLIRTNVEKVINRELLYEKFGLNWWIQVYFGLFLTSSCAPLTHFENIGTLLIASGGTREWKYPTGSDPLLDNNIRWADVNVVHDGYEISRQGKTKHLIRKYVNETGDYLFLRVCTKQSFGNCSKCEKCFRTITGLVLEGIDPNKCGFHNVDSKTFDLIKASLINGDLARGLKRSSLVERKGKFIGRMSDVFFWEDIQKHIPETISGSKNYGEFFRWLKDFDIQRHSKEVKISWLPRLLLGSIVQNLAPLNSYLPRNFRKINRKMFRFLSRTHIV